MTSYTSRLIQPTGKSHQGNPPNIFSSPSAGHFKVENNGFHNPAAVNLASHGCLGWKEQLTSSAAGDLTLDEEKHIQELLERDQITLHREISSSMTS
jgi:hypothetical protein